MLSRIWERANEPLDVSPALVEAKTVGIFNEIDERLLIGSDAAAATIDTNAPSLKYLMRRPYTQIKKCAGPWSLRPRQKVNTGNESR